MRVFFGAKFYGFFFALTFNFLPRYALNLVLEQNGILPNFVFFSLVFNILL